MKSTPRLFIFACLVLVLASPRAHAFVGQRCDWWNAHLKQTVAERERLAREGAHPALLESLDAETAAARETVAYFERVLKGDDSLRHEKKAYTADELAAAVGTITRPLFAIAWLDLSASLPAEKSSLAAVRAAASDALAARLHRGTQNAGSAYAVALVEETAARPEFQALARETLLAHMIGAKDEALTRFTAAVAARVRSGIAAEGRSLSPRELEDITIDAAAQEIDGISRLVPLPGADELRDRPSWQALTARIDEEEALIEKMGALYRYAAKLDAPGRRALFKNPSALQEKIFTAISSAYMEILDAPLGPDDAASSRGRLMKMPPLPGGIQFMHDADALRKSCVLSVTGLEPADHFDALRQRLLSLYAHCSGEALAAVAREEDDAAREKAKGGSIANGKEFSLAKARLLEKLRLLREYATRSADYCQWLSLTKKIDGARVQALCAAQSAEYGRYARSISALAQEAAGAASFARPWVIRRHAAACRQSDHILKSLALAQGIDKNTMRFLGAQQVRDIKTARASFQAVLLESRAAVAKAQATFNGTRDDAARHEKSAAKGMEHALAQFEVSQLTSLLEKQLRALKSLRYAETALPAYTKAYSALQETLERGETSPLLEKSLSLGSVIPTVKEFDQDRIRKEHGAKQALRKAIAAALSRISLLVAFYRQKGIDIRDAPSDDSAAAMRAAITGAVEVMVADWKMNEANFEEIDRNAAAKLLLRRNRRLWGASPTEDGRGEPGKKISLGPANMSITLPGGWIERAPDHADAKRGVVGRIESADSQARILVALVPLAGRGIKRAGEEWMKGAGSTIVKQRWGSTGEVEYYWTLSSDKAALVRESYTIAHNGSALIVTGSASREIYAAFREKLEMVFGSLCVE